jgi:hypothetical protein
MDREKLLMLGKLILQEKSQIRHRLNKMRGKNESKGEKVMGKNFIFF